MYLYVSILYYIYKICPYILFRNRISLQIFVFLGHVITGAVDLPTTVAKQTQKNPAIKDFVNEIGIREGLVL